MTTTTPIPQIIKEAIKEIAPTPKPAAKSKKSAQTPRRKAEPKKPTENPKPAEEPNKLA